MKHLLTISIFLFIAHKGLSQGYMDEIVKKTCECLDHVPDTLGTDQYNMQLGGCMITESMSYKKQIKKDYGIDMDKIDADSGEKLGRIIGVKMLTACPAMLTKLTKRSQAAEASAEQNLTATGTVTKIENDFFINFSIKDDAGKTTKFYWLTFIESPIDLTTSYSTLMGKAVKITYESKEFFDPKLMEYRKYNIIKSLDLN